MSKVIRKTEVELNGTKFPLAGDGQVHPILASVLPQKLVTGEYSKAANPLVDTIVVDDQRGGGGIEFATEGQDVDRYWFSTADTSFRGSVVLPRLATSITLPTAPTAPTITNADMETAASGWTNGTASGARSSAEAHGGTYSWAVTAGQADGTYTIIQDVAWDVDYQNLSFTFTCWAKVNVQAGSGVTARISLDDGVSTTNGTTVGETATWTQLTVTKTLANTATRLRLILEVVVVDWTSGTPITYFDDAALTTGALTLGNPTKFANFNGNTYIGFGTVLAKLNTSTGASADFVHQMPQTITALLATVNSTLLVYQGDANNYLYMNTSEAFTTTNSPNASLGVTWDDKAWKFDQTTNIIYHAATPNSATPTWTANGTLDAVKAGSVNTLYVDVDATGDTIIYAATTEGLYAHDSTNAVWVAPKLQTPFHTNGGKGAAVWRDAAYISAGLDLWKYVPDASPALIQAVGLSREGGMPAEFLGEVMALIPGYNFLYALVDATQSSIGTYSTVMQFDGRAWSTLYDTGADSAVTGGIVTNVYAYQILFNVGSALYSVPIERAWANPLKISSHTYGAAGIHVTPHYTGNWETGNKRILALKVFADGMSANETITVSYRSDYSNTDWATGWTTLGSAITTDGLTTFLFPNSSTPTGSAVKAIQFKFALARGGTTTNTPVLKYFLIEYQKVIPPTWAWRFQVNCTDAYAGKGAGQLIDALIAAAETATLVTFLYDTTTEYVEVLSVEGEQLTGANSRRGIYTVTVRAPQ